MRKIIGLSSAVALAMGLAACSEKTQDAAATTAESAGDDVANAADKAAAATDELGDKAAAAAKTAGAKVEQERAEIEADAHNESVEEAKKD